jgi:hypothetical protein
LNRIIRADISNPDSFGDLANFSTFNVVAALGADIAGYDHPIAHSNYLYFIPSPYVTHGKLLRYNTEKSFTNTGAPADPSYEVFDLDSVIVGGDILRFTGSFIKGDYIYFVPSTYNPAEGRNLLIRYNTSLPFDDPGSYEYVEINLAAAPNAKGFDGGLVLGNYAYLIPYYNQNIVKRNGNLVRIDLSDDSTAEFQNPANYTSFNLASLDPLGETIGYRQATTDGRYIYLAPYWNNKVKHGKFLRYDTSLDFNDPNSYEWFDLQAEFVDPELITFGDIVYDGSRYIILVPFFGYNFNSKLVIYDTQAPFRDTNSYQIVDLESFSPYGKDFYGGVINGDYIYLIPYGFRELVQYKFK